MINIFIILLAFKLNICGDKIFQNKSNDQNSNITLINRNLYSYKNLNKNKNLILGIIETYSINTILPFFKSLIHANFQSCDIIMFVRNVSQMLINYLKSVGVFVYEIPEGYKNFPVVKMRWKIYLDFLNGKKNEYDLVLSADVRDTFFQKDVFQYYENHTKPFLGIAIEDGTLNEEYNKKWIIDFVGEEKYKIIQNERIICAGSILGTSDKFLELARIFWENLLINFQTTDQGILNYLFYDEKLFKDCIVKSDNYGPIMTIGLTESKNIILDKEYNVLNFKGEIASVIHQYDRNIDIMKRVIKKFCPELLIINEFSNKLNSIIFASLFELFIIIILLKVIINKKYNKNNIYS